MVWGVEPFQDGVSYAIDLNDLPGKVALGNLAEARSDHAFCRLDELGLVVVGRTSP